MKNLILIVFITLLPLLHPYVSTRTVYLMMHGEKPGKGKFDNNNKFSTTDNIEGAEKKDGLGITGLKRAECMVEVFGPNAPIERQPKEIIYQHFQGQPEFIDSFLRDLHYSQRMYQQVVPLAKALNIDLSKQKCCGGDGMDVLNYILQLPPEVDPVLVMYQHQQISAIARGLARAFNQTEMPRYGMESDKVYTVQDGKLIEKWRTACPGLEGGARAMPNFKLQNQTAENPGPKPNYQLYDIYLPSERNETYEGVMSRVLSQSKVTALSTRTTRTKTAKFTFEKRKERKTVFKTVSLKKTRKNKKTIRT
ncbi:hypothetical protein PIROE2DRAFT_13503 [Piromyces sp. E2]|nr:hypothetical protein PIROE2DRAFT_13503 [Piromyces sp. E2]|eukprot:OUM60684.1 hypothetical protein PIROE2DRAFT_13503 [Piromyces sp. E2]